STGLPGGGAVQGRMAFTRKGKVACQLSRWVRVKIINGRGNALPVKETRLNAGGSVNALAVHKPGHGSVISKLLWLNWCHGKIQGPIMLRVTLPDAGGTKDVSVNQLGFAGVETPSCVNPTAGSGIQVG